MTMICPICGRDTQHADADQVVKCEQCLRSFQLEPMNTESQQQIAREAAEQIAVMIPTSFGFLFIPIILSAIERAKVAVPDGMLSGGVQKMDAAAQRQPQRIEQQEWTGITLLDAKWLDPECHEGCQSLKFKNQLLYALAAIEKHNQAVEDWGKDNRGCARIDVDLSLLHEHDAEVRKTLVDALERLRAVIQESAVTSNMIIDNALAKVKQ